VHCRSDLLSRFELWSCGRCAPQATLFRSTPFSYAWVCSLHRLFVKFFLARAALGLCLCSLLPTAFEFRSPDQDLRFTVLRFLPFLHEFLFSVAARALTAWPRRAPDFAFRHDQLAVQRRFVGCRSILVQGAHFAKFVSVVLVFTSTT
jgi:hypothetical protein